MKNKIKKASVQFREDLLYFRHFMQILSLPQISDYHHLKKLIHTNIEGKNGVASPESVTVHLKKVFFLHVQSNFNGSNNYSTMKISSRQGYVELMRVDYSTRSGGLIWISFPSSLS